MMKAGEIIGTIVQGRITLKKKAVLLGDKNDSFPRHRSYLVCMYPLVCDVSRSMGCYYTSYGVLRLTISLTEYVHLPHMSEFVKSNTDFEFG
jgi:hypothetical protein